MSWQVRAIARNPTSKALRRLCAGAILAVTALISYHVATWIWTPDGARWVASEGPERFETRGGVLFLDRRIAPIVQKHYAQLIEDWSTVIASELRLVPEHLPTTYFFYDRETFEKYAKPDDSVTRAFYRGPSHEVYTHGSFLGSQLAPIDEEGTLVHELTHALVRSSIGKIPIWLDEGLAHFVEQGAIEDGKFHSGIPSVDHLNAVFSALEEDRLPPLEQLFKMRGRAFNHMGPLSRGMAHFIVMRMDEQGQLEDLLGDISASKDLGSKGVARALCEKAGTDLAGMQKEFVGYLRGQSDLKAFGEGSRLAADGRHDEALPFYRKAIEGNRTRGVYWSRLGMSLYLVEEGGSEEESAAAYRSAAEAGPYPEQRTTLTIVGNNLFENGHPTEARRVYEKLLQRQLPTPTILHHLAVTYMDEDPGKALRLLNEALALPREGIFFRKQFQEIEALRAALTSGAGSTAR